MKIFYIEANENEMRANRTILDVLGDMAHAVVDAFYTPVPDDAETDDAEDKEKEE